MASSAIRPPKKNYSAFHNQMNVFKALILRDVKTRFFGNGLGYVVAMMWPLTHMLILLGIYVLAGRTAPLGDSVLLFLAIAVVPVIAFRYMTRYIAMSVINNRVLLSFPIVNLMDIIYARAMLEAACAVCACFILAIMLYSIGISIQPDDAADAAWAFLANILLGLGVGAMFGVMALPFPGVLLVLMFLSVFLYIASGILFLPSFFPEQIQNILWYNPLLHSVEWMREAYYSSYMSPILNKEYLIAWGVLPFLLAQIIAYFFRDALRR